jgi:hypothetical protein
MQLKLAANSFFNGNGSGNGAGAIVDFTSLPQAEQLAVTLFMPLNDNDGQSFPPELLQQVVNKVVVSFGGVTVLPPAKGYWLSEAGDWFEDQVSLVQVVIPRGPEPLHRLNAIVAEWARDLQQYEIFLYTTPAYRQEDLLAHVGPVLWRHLGTDGQAESAPVGD